MQTPDLAAKIAELEKQLLDEKKSFANAFSENQPFSETRIILRRIKSIMEELENSKKLNSPWQL
jgi:hypothetical protein